MKYDNLVSNIKNKVYLNRSYLCVFLRFFKNKQKFNRDFFDRDNMKFFPDVISSAIGTSLDLNTIIYRKKVDKRSQKVQTFFGYIDTRREGFLVHNLHISSNVYFNFPLTRTLSDDRSILYRSEESWRLDSFFFRLKMRANKVEFSRIYSTKGHDFGFAQKEKNNYFIVTPRITIDDAFTPIVKRYSKIMKKLSKKEIKRLKFSRRLSRVFAIRKKNPYYFIFMLLNSRYFSLIKNFLVTNISRKHNVFFIFKDFKRFLNYILQDIGGFLLEYKNISFIYKNYFSNARLYINYIKKNTLKKTIIRRTIFRSLKKYKKSSLQPSFFVKKEYINNKISKIKHHVQQFPRSFFRTKSNVYKKESKWVNTTGVFKKAQEMSYSLFPMTLASVSLEPVNIFFDSSLSMPSKVLAINSSFKRDLLSTMQKINFYLNLFKNNQVIKDVIIFNSLKLRRKLNSSGLYGKSFFLYIKNILSDNLTHANQFYKTVNYFLNFEIWKKINNKNALLTMQKLFPLNLHKTFLNFIKDVGNIRNIQKYPKIFKAWTTRFLGVNYPNYKIIIRPYRQLRGSVQLNVLTENNNNLFSSWPGLVFKKPEIIVGEHQEHKYIYLRFLKRKTAKLDYNAKLLAARHVSNFLYTLLKKRPGTIEVIMRRPVDSMSKTLIDAVVPQYFWKNKHYQKFQKKIIRFEKKRKKKIGPFESLTKIITSVYNLKFSFRSMLFKYIFKKFSFKLQENRSLFLLYSISSNFDTSYYLQLIGQLRLEIRHFMVLFVLLFKISKLSISKISFGLKTYFNKHSRSLTMTALDSLLTGSDICKSERFFFKKNLKKFLKKKLLSYRYFNRKTDEYNFSKLYRFLKLLKSSFSKLGPFVLTKKICFIPEKSHGSYQKPRKKRRV